MNIRANSCQASLLQVINNELFVEESRFEDNVMTDGGTNGIVAISSKLNLSKLDVRETKVTNSEDIKADVGFLSIFEGSNVYLGGSNFEQTSGIRSAGIYSRGRNSILIEDSFFKTGQTREATGAFLDIEGAKAIQIVSTDFQNN